MDLCSKNHAEVCYDGRFCPACELMDQLTDALERIKEIEDDLSDAEQAQ